MYNNGNLWKIMVITIWCEKLQLFTKYILFNSSAANEILDFSSTKN